ncbi:MAG: hypothetical protein ACPL06_01920 [Candidatus Anstonellales archaeon]
MKIKVNEVGHAENEKPNGRNPFNLFKTLVPLVAALSLYASGCATGQPKHPIYGTEPVPATSIKPTGVRDTSKTADRPPVKPNGGKATGTAPPSYEYETRVYTRPTLDTLRVDTPETKLRNGKFTVIGREGKELIVTTPSSRYLTLLFEGLGEPPLREISKIVDSGNVVEIYDEKGLYLRVRGLPGDTVVIEERWINKKVIDGREVYSDEMIETYKQKGSFYLDTSKNEELQYTLRVSKSGSIPIPQESSDVIREGVVAPSSEFAGYSAFGSPLSVTPQDDAGIVILLNIQNPYQWYFQENSLIKTLRRVNGGSLSPADLREFFVGPYFNSILAVRELGYVPNVRADLNAAIAFRLFPWLHGNIGGKGETSVIGTEFVSRGTPYVGLAFQVPWHLGQMGGTHDLGVRLNPYKIEKGYVLNLVDTTTLVFENRGWSLDLGYLLSVNNDVGLSLGVNDALYSIYGTKVIYDPDLKEKWHEYDIYIRPPTTMVTGLAFGGLHSPIVIGLDANWLIANRSVTYSGIQGAIAFTGAPFNVPFAMGLQGGYTLHNADKWISLVISIGPGGQITGGGSLGGGVRNANFTDHRYGFGLYGRK